MSLVNADRLTGCADYLILSPQKSRYWDELARTSFSSHTEPAGGIKKKAKLILAKMRFVQFELILARNVILFLDGSYVKFLTVPYRFCFH